jgi:hypothetical protein
MRRREFIAALGGLPLWSCPTLAQQRPFKTPRIGIVDNAPTIRAGVNFSF